MATKRQRKPKPGSPEHYKKVWNIELPFDPNRDWTHHQEIRALFEEASWKRRANKHPAGDFQFFLAVYGSEEEGEAKAAYRLFLKDVSTCPEAVLRVVREYINPPREAGRRAA